MTPSESPVPHDFQVLSDTAQIRAIAREERIQMLNILAREALSVSAVAKRLGMAPNRAHYHMQQLLKHGLITEVGTGRRRWKEERFYLAAARHFLMDPRLACGDSEAAAVLESAEAAFLDWRRRAILNIDLGEVAALVVGDCLRVRPGEVVLVQFGSAGFDLAEAVIVEIEASGGVARPRVWSHAFLTRTLDRNAPEALVSKPFIDPDLEAALDAVVAISSTMSRTEPPSPAQRQKLPFLLDAWSRWQRALRARRTRFLELALPHRRDLESGQVSPEESANIYWRCVRTDYAGLERRANELLATIYDRRRLALRCARGTQLELEIDPDHHLVNDGVISATDLEAGRCLDVLPAGSLVVLPVPGSANGTYLADYVVVGGQHIRDLRIELRHGRITAVDAPEGAELVRRAIDEAAGEPDQLSSLSFGINAAGRGPTGMPVLDGCLAGTLTLAFGNNEILGGQVRATLDLTLPSTRLTVRAGDSVLVEDGRLPGLGRLG